MEYFRDIVIAATLCGVVIALSPSEESGTGKYVKYLTSLVLLLVLLAPLARLYTSADEITDTIRNFFSQTVPSPEAQSSYDAAITMNAAALSDRISTDICESFSITPEDLTVSVTLDTENVTSLSVISVDIRLYTDKIDPSTVASYVESLGFEVCNVTKGD